MNMKPEHKRLWLEALRSGEYKQSVGLLRDHHGYCCLGVLAEVCGNPDGWKNSNTSIQRYNGRLGGLVPEEFGLGHYTQGQLQRMNDKQGKNFKQIADWVEKNISVEEEDIDAQ